jgi:hypothetical protein
LGFETGRLCGDDVGYEPPQVVEPPPVEAPWTMPPLLELLVPPLEDPGRPPQTGTAAYDVARGYEITEKAIKKIMRLLPFFISINYISLIII